jgi:hypothetical protein
MAKSLAVVKAKKENAFAQIQMIYELTKKTADKDVLQKFLIRAKSVSKLRQEFLDALDAYHELELEADPDFVPNYAPLNSIDELVDYINANAALLESKKQTTKPKAVENPPSVVRLPKLELKHFSGEPLEWVSFINLYDSSIHKNASLNAVTKFQYLLSAVSGEPLNLIKSLPISDANYTVAYDLLKDRYHSPRRLVTLHLNQILDLPSVNHTPKQMRKFLNSYNENIQALKGLAVEIASKDNPLLSAMILRKMDIDLRKRFEHFRSQNITDEGAGTPVLPDVADMIKFLNQECNEIEEANLHSTPISSKPHSSDSYHDFSPRNKSFKSKKNLMGSNKVSLMACDASDDKSNTSKLPQCFVCKKSDHKVYACSIFKKKDPKSRYTIVRQNKRCTSCLGNHKLTDCQSASSCFKCDKHHHTLLHFDETPSLPSAPADNSRPTLAPQESETSPSVVALTSSPRENTHLHKSPTTVLLGTLLVKLTTPRGTSHVFRALADSGSQSCFLTERAAQLLCAPRIKDTHSVVGLSQIPTRTKGLTSLTVETLSGKVMSTDHEFLILDKICVDLPSVKIAPEILEMVRPYVLADPTFHLPGGIDVLLGGSLFPLMLTQGTHNLGPGLPSLIGTHFGFLVMGNVPCISQSDCGIRSQLSTTLLAVNDIDLHNSLQRFWHQEEPPTVSKQSEEDKLCDKHFLSTHTRDQTGRYCVRLPFKADHPPLGQSISNAENRLHSIERKFKSQPEFKSLYSDFMTEYLSLGHMELAQNIDLTAPHYFLPHHGVLKESSSTTRLRTVFDASAKTSNGISLNHILLTGRKMQTNICDLLLSFRTHNVVFSCDIRQMYRQIKVHPDDQCYQLILWRDNVDQTPSIFKLTTVTYGINCSPYLAIRTLHQLAADEGNSYPEAAEILRTQTFVDDVIAGGDSEEEALILQKQLISLLERGGFELRKWTSNSSRLLQDLPDGHLESPVFLQDSLQPHFTILGIHWSPTTDSFTYNLNLPQNSRTKRQVLSVIAQIYDPCGFLSPIVMWAKQFMQLIWTKGLNWDQPLPPELLEMWKGFIGTTCHLHKISIPRALQVSQSCSTELHGFSDASEGGYAAAIYLRCTLNDGSVVIRQLLSKTRVAPLKKLTIPRLELSAALLLAQLVAYVLSTFQKRIDSSSVVLWCDSTVTLTWLQTPPYRLKTFVANRVAQVQELVPSHCWRHIASEHNPADCASRGILPSELPDHRLWWFGPSWLEQPRECWPVSNFTPSELSETGESKPQSDVMLVSMTPPEWDILTRFSHFSKLQRVMAYVLRFISNCRHPQKINGPLTTRELTAAQLKIFQQVQASAFPDEIAALKNNKLKSLSTSLRRLSPIIDDGGILRVGGRLSASQLSEDKQHPVILPKRHHVVNLLIDFYHKKYLHAGAQLTQSLLAQSVWILSARSIIRSRIFQCITCFRQKPRNKPPLMGNLPTARVTPSRPFLNTGVDYGGPFNIKVYNLRSIRYMKAYICVFVCLVTKAVHIEVATDLSTEAFIAALTRFASRRGLPKNIYCDCGTNFVGADNALKALIKSKQTSLLEFTSQQGITFHFNPPAAPHQGGLWEGAIKSVKHHLRRVIGEHVLTLSEFMTLTTQVEAILNSRPLTPLSNDPSDISALTPGHFLIGSTLVTVPEEDSHDTPNNRLKHWQLIQALHQRIWRRWHLEYLHTLQQRGKWNQATVNLQVGDLVLIHQPTPPLLWPLARITAVSPGKDGVVRVVHLKTQQGILTRPAHKVFPLPDYQE